jgi:choline dehydrogenase
MTMYGDHGREIVPEHGFMVEITLARPDSRGSIMIRTSCPAEQPNIQPECLSRARDLVTLRDGIKFARDVFAQPAFKRFRGAEYFPGSKVRSDGEIDSYVRATSESIYHPAGTCKMGSDALAVVDERLRVHGVEGLRVPMRRSCRR